MLPRSIPELFRKDLFRGKRPHQTISLLRIRGCKLLHNINIKSVQETTSCRKKLGPEFFENKFDISEDLSENLIKFGY